MLTSEGNEGAMDRLKNSKKLKKIKKKFKFMGKSVMESIKKSDDPLKELGVGITSYHWLLTRLFALFLVLWLIHWPVIDIFKSYTEYNSNKHAGFGIYRSLGNMGFASVECKIRAMRKNSKARFKCHSGKIDSIVDWGVTSREDVS